MGLLHSLGKFLQVENYLTWLRIVISDGPKMGMALNHIKNGNKFLSKKFQKLTHNELKGKLSSP